MDAAVSVFINGIAGVFAGVAILYLAMKIIPLVARIGNSEDD